MIRLLQSTILFQAFGYMLQFAAMVLFAKTLGPEKQGILSLFRSTGQIVVVILWIGLPASIIYFIGKDSRYYKSVLKNCFNWFIVSFGMFAAAIFALPFDRIPQIIIFKQYFTFLLIFVFLLSLFVLFQSLTLSLKKYFYYNLFTFGFGITIFLGSIIASILSSDAERLINAIGCYIVAYAMMFLYGVSLTLKEGFSLREQISIKLAFADQFRVGFRGYISTIAALLLFRVDIFLVAYFLSYKEECY